MRLFVLAYLLLQVPSILISHDLALGEILLANVENRSETSNRLLVIHAVLS